MQQKLAQAFPNACFGDNSGLPYIAFPAKATLSENLHAIEKILTILSNNGISLPVLLDVKGNLIEVRYSIDDEQIEILNSVLS